MKLLAALTGGLAGALSVTLLHELIRKINPGAPRLDLLGEQATTRIIDGAGGDAPKGDALYVTSMTGDLISNSLYYSLAGARNDKPVFTGLLLGVSAGLGAVNLPSTLGLNEEFTAGDREKMITTIGLYALGGLIAGSVIRHLK